MPTDLDDVEAFLGHSSQSHGGSFLKNWKDPAKGGLGHIDVWLHRNSPLATAVWRHSSYRFDVVEDKETKEPRRVVKWATLVCPESEEVVKMQGRHSKQTRELLAPYECCPMHLMLEWLFQMVDSGQMPWLEEVFRFDAGDGKPVVLHAAGLYGGIKDDLGPEKWAEAERAGIYKKTAFKESWKATLNYVFRVADNANLKEGVQIAIEPGSLGDHTKLRIREAMEPEPIGWGKEMGNPKRNPYCIRWQKNAGVTEPAKMYSAMITKIPFTEEVDQVITNTDGPDISSVVSPPAWGAVRSTLERVALVDMPWDDFFKHVEQGEDLTKDDKKLQQRARVPEVGGGQSAVGAGGGQRYVGPEANRTAARERTGVGVGPELRALQGPAEAPQQAFPPASEQQRFACENDACDNVLLESETFCVKCGTPSGAPPPPPPPARPAKRSEAAQGGQAGNPGFRPPQQGVGQGSPTPQTVRRDLPSSYTGHQMREPPEPALAQPPRPQARQPAPPPRRPEPQQAAEFDAFPFGHNAPQGQDDVDVDLAEVDPLPWGRK
jgi:hypothetical protein